MSGIFDFIKKQPTNANPSNSGSADPSVTGAPASQTPSDSFQTKLQEPVKIQETKEVVTNSQMASPQPQAYNGIGNPPKPAAPTQTVGAKQEKPAPEEKPKNILNNPNLTTKANPGQLLDSKIGNKKRAELDVMTHLTPRSNKVFIEANKKARELNNAFIDSEHILYGLLSDSQVFKLLTEMKVQPQQVEAELVKIYKKENSQAAPQISPRVKLIVGRSLVVARKLGYEFVSPEHILLSLYEEGEGAGSRILAKLGITKEDINKKITGKKESLLETEGSATKEKQKSVLDQYTIDMTAKAQRGELDPVVERSEVIEQVVHILSRRIKNNPALIGEPGVGKTAIVEGLAQRIVTGQVPDTLLNKRILQLDLASVVAGASHRGEFEERMKKVVDELKASKGEVIMFIDEMHTMMGAGSGEGALDASNFIKPALARGEVQFIGATTITEYRKYVEKDAALERRFQTVVVPEPNEEASIKMLKASRDKYEAFHKVKIPDEVITASVRLSKRYIGERFLPDKAFDLMDEAAAAVRLPLISLPEEIKSLEDRVSQLKQELQEDEKSGEKVKARILRSKIDEIQANLSDKKEEYNSKKAQTTTEVSVDIVKDIVAKHTGIPLSKIGSSEGDKLKNLEDIIHKRMINQERAVKAVAQAIRRGRAGLKSSKRPIGSFVFLGPTGVGKTELAKTMSEILFDEEEAVIRFDMTEYMERHEVAKLLGSPPGYVGFEDGGKLTEAVRRKPYSLVLFDEIEKAHPDIFNILLQILDDGRLTDNKGHTISFKNTVVICTSNIGTGLIQEDLLKSGKSEVTEPPVVSTYVFTPRGRELLTIGNKYFERDKQTKNIEWVPHDLSDYFAGQTIQPLRALQNTATNPDSTGQAPNQEVPAEKKIVNFPVFGFDTHAVSQKGVEIISKGPTLFIRTATTAKTWNTSNLINYFKDQIVINAIPDTPDEQLPTIRLSTHTFSPAEMEMVTYKDRFWRRKEGSTDWQTGMLRDYFTDTVAKNSTGKAVQFPVTHWDVQAFSSSGKEIILSGNTIWSREGEEKEWLAQKIEEFFGKNFPLKAEIENKEIVESQTDIKQYQVIKDKVMNELLKFFRPELVNRFDEVIVFEPLKYHHMAAIVKLQLKALSKLLDEQELGFYATEEAVKEIVRSGFDPVYGARPLRRAIQRLIENPISEMIISGKVKAGDMIIVDHDGIDFIFNIENASTQPIGKSGENDGKKEMTKSFHCNTCGNEFSTLVISNATPICAKCASSMLVESTKGSETIKKANEVSVKVSDSEKKTNPAPAQMPKNDDADYYKNLSQQQVVN